MASSPAAMPALAPKPASALPEVVARDAMMAWFRGEFAAANAIIDALCHHLTQVTGPDQRQHYESVFAAIHRRRLNWIPILHMQKYFSIAEIAIELRRTAAAKQTKLEYEIGEQQQPPIAKAGATIVVYNDGGEKKEENVCKVVEEEADGENLCASDRQTEEGDGSHGDNFSSQSFQIISDEEISAERSARIKITKGFIAKEPVKGHMVNVVKGLKLYEDIFTEMEISKLTDYIDELRLAGRKGELSGETFILFNKQLKGNKREIIQLGTPIFQPIKDSATSSIEPIPSTLQEVIDQLIQCRLLPESRKPNSCIINFFDEGEYSQPYMKPPHLDQPISTLLLSESTMAFGRALVSDHDGNFKGPLMLSLKKGSLLVMRGNSAEMARHVMCPSLNKRISLTFFKVRALPATASTVQPTNIPPLTRAMTLWQPGRPYPYKLPRAVFGYHQPMCAVPKWGVLRAAPVVMLGPDPQNALMAPAKRLVRSGSGTGVFLPWSVGSRKSPKHVPPRIQRVRLLPPSSSTGIEPAQPPADLDVKECE